MYSSHNVISQRFPRLFAGGVVMVVELLDMVEMVQVLMYGMVCKSGDS